MTQEGIRKEAPSEEGEAVDIEVLTFLARITGNYSRGTNKWYYDWQSVVPGSEGEFDNGTYQNLQNQESGDDSIRAINVMEDKNTDICVAPGVCIDCEYPEEWEPQPIGGETCNVQPIVVMYQMTVSGAAPSYVFQAENSHDGTCPEGTGDPQP